LTSLRLTTALTAILLALGPCSAQAQRPGSDGPKKVLRTAFRTAETGFDPQRIDDRYSVGVCENIFEGLLTYDYLARPAKLVPLVAEEIPTAEEGGTRYTFRIKPGILYADDAAFKGQKRELVARDFEYAFKRFRDPKNRSPYEWLFENKLVGLDELAARAKKTGNFDYEAKIPGIEVRDKYTISFKLKDPDFNFLYVLAMPNVVPVAREVIEAYGADTHAHPVGTGPYMLTEWIRRFKIVLERNPNHRGYELDTRYANMSDEWDRRAIEALRGKRLPLLDRIEIYPMDDEQPRFLAFLNKEHDIMEETPFAFIDQVLPGGKLAPNLAKQGIRVFREEQPELTYHAFNMNDIAQGKPNPVGGYSPARVALRRAMVMAYDRESEIRILRKGQALGAESPIPPGVVGYDPDFHSDTQEHDVAKAKALLDMFGYVDRDGDGYREQPDGTPLVIGHKFNATGQEFRQLAELFVKSLKEVGLKVDPVAVQFGDLLKDKKVSNYVTAQSAWIADYPDAQNFLQLLYGPNTGQSNEAEFKLAAYDRLYEKSLGFPDGEERNKLYRDMTRLLLAYAPWRLGVHRIFNHLQYPWVKGYKKHPILYTNYKYLDIDVAAQQAGTK
jgi:oligopeptide transport system substrate-binding protein